MATYDEDVRFTTRVENNLRTRMGDWTSFALNMSKAHFDRLETSVRDRWQQAGNSIAIVESALKCARTQLPDRV